MNRNSVALLVAAALILAACPAVNREAPEPDLGPLNPMLLPTGQQVTPTLAPGSTFASLKPGLAKYPDLDVAGAVTEALSPDARALAVLTTGYNRWNDPQTGKRDPGLQNEYVFLFDVSTGRAVQKQVLVVPNTWAGIAFSPAGDMLYISGGVDDSVHAFARDGEVGRERAAPIALEHAAANGPAGKPIAAGLAVTGDGRLVVVANMYNDSVTLIDGAKREAVGEIDLRPGRSGRASGKPGGNYPYRDAIRGNDIAYVSIVRHREHGALDSAARALTARVVLPGNPKKMILDKAGARLFAAMDNPDSVAVFLTPRLTTSSTLGPAAPA